MSAGFYSIYLRSIEMLAWGVGSIYTANTYNEAQTTINSLIHGSWKTADPHIVWVNIGTSGAEIGGAFGGFLRISFIKDGKWQEIYDGKIDKSESFKPACEAAKGTAIPTPMPEYS